jgi:catechol 2,3-dioxygenase-like lactoylglutathione lyase family enzyme
MSEADRAIPTLPGRSLPATLAFYERLGFEGELLADGTYLIVERGSIELHFFPHPDLVPAESAFGAYIRVQDVETLYRAFAQAQLPRTGIPRMDRLEDKPWGMREFAVIDPDGSLLRIGQVI